MQTHLQAARSYGYALVSRSPDRAVIFTPSLQLLNYDVLHILEFDSDRKCMSVIVRERWSARILLYSKGADSSIFSNLAQPDSGVLIDSDRRTSISEVEEEGGVRKGEGRRREEVGEDGEVVVEEEGVLGDKMRRELTEQHLTLYAKEGLRTLCMAKRVGIHCTCTCTVPSIGNLTHLSCEIHVHVHVCAWFTMLAHTCTYIICH